MSTTIYVSKETKAKIDRIASRDRRTISATVDLLADRYLEEQAATSQDGTSPDQIEHKKSA